MKNDMALNNSTYNSVGPEPGLFLRHIVHPAYILTYILSVSNVIEVKFILLLTLFLPPLLQLCIHLQFMFTFSALGRKIWF